MERIVIAAMGQERELGKDNQLIWHIPLDLKLFKKHTLGHTLIMGRKTYESIGRPLPGRTTIVISRTLREWPDGVLAATSLEQALDMARAQGAQKAFIAGGGEIYRAGLPYADQLLLSRIEAQEDKADTYFPKWGPEWVLTDSLYFPGAESLGFHLQTWERSTRFE